jgi:hypothetical protein
MNTRNDSLRALRDDELLERLKALAARERGATAELVAHLAEVQARRLHLAAGYPSMYAYGRHALRLSEYAAYHRIKAARVSRRFPVVLDLLAEGAVTLTTVRLLAPHLTDANHVEVLESARGASKSAVQRLVAALAPQPDVPTSVRKVRAPKTTVTASPSASDAARLAPAETAGAASSPVSAASVPAQAIVSAVAPTPVPTVAHEEPRPTVASPLSPDRYKLQLTIGGDTLERLELAKDMLRHAMPSGDAAEIFDRALRLLLTELAKGKFAATDRPRPSLGVGPASHDVPAEVKRVVFVRDFGRCAFVSKEGHRCNARGLLEFHHVRPFSEGGRPTVDNIELRCRAHNGYEWYLRSTEVRIREENWLCRRVAAGLIPTKRVSMATERTSSGARWSRGAEKAPPTTARPPCT